MIKTVLFTRIPKDSAHDLWKLGEEYRKAAQVVFREIGPTSWPGNGLFGQAIELYLKAFLSAHGLVAAELKKVGHDLTRALRKAEENGFAKDCRIDSADRRCLEKLSSVYKGKDFRYLHQGSWELPIPSWVLEFTSRLSRAVEKTAISDLQTR
jgi:hypothetical protein